jgi:hypothetical protein
MLYRVTGTCMEHRLTVGLFHPDIEGCYRIVSYLIFPADINTSEEFDVINCKTWDLFHIYCFYLESIFFGIPQRADRCIG